MNYHDVGMVQDARCDYPDPPYHPPNQYLEFASLPYQPDRDPANQVYNQVRELFIQLGLDRGHVGTPGWKPFRELIKPGQRVVIKPNLVRGNHPLGHAGVLSIITHASVIRPVIDYLLLSTNGNCQIIIADCILQSSDWNEVITESGLRDLVEYYRAQNIQLELLDLRKEISYFNSEKIISKREFKERDPQGYASIDLNRSSALYPIREYSERLMITDYTRGSVSQHHHGEVNEYYIAKTMLSADLFINVPKLKTHRKAGLTVALKNIIGINGDKRWIAHHRVGKIGTGGDEYPKIAFWRLAKSRIFSMLKRHQFVGVWLATVLKKVRRVLEYGHNRIATATDQADYDKFKSVYPQADRKTYQILFPPPGVFSEGSWYGNDTVWRTIADLNYILFYADRAGRLHHDRQRNYFCLVDGITAGEKEGPMECLPKKAGLVLAGFHPLAVDFVAAKIMGFDYAKIPSLNEIRKNPMINFAGITPENVNILSSQPIDDMHLQFIAPINWRGHIELQPHHNPRPHG
ncbi:MAG: DUF362 domain-containing protein [Patescibacteria group bacterium]